MVERVKSEFDRSQRHFMVGGFFANHGLQSTDEQAVFERYREWCDSTDELGFTSVGVSLPWEKIQPDGPDSFEWEWADRWWDYAVEEAGHDLVPILDETGVSAPSWLDVEQYAQRTPEDDIVTTHGGKPVLTFHSEDLDEHVLRMYRNVVEHVLDRYGLDSVVGVQNVTWPNMESTYPGDIDHTDYSDHAQQAFRKWLRNRYDSVADLNRAWDTDYDGFETTSIGTEPAARATAVRKFRAWSLAQHVREEYRVVKEIEPELGYFLRSGGLDDWDDVHGEKTSLVAAKYCDVIGEDNEYPRPFVYGSDAGHGADINYYRTGADVRGIGWNMELDSLEIGNSELGPNRINEEYRDNGLYGFDLGCQMVNVCHWEPGSLEQYGERSLGSYDDPSAWTYLPQLAEAATHSVREFSTPRAYYYSYWGGLADREADLRETYAERTLYGDRQFAYDVLAAPLYVDPSWEAIDEPGCWNDYNRGIWVPDGRVLGAVERKFLERAYRDGVNVALSRPADVGTYDEYGREAEPLVETLRAVGDEQAQHNASVEYSREESPWSYAFLDGATLRALEYDGDRGLWTGPDGEAFVGPHTQHPTPRRATARVWEAPSDGTVTVEGAVESVQKFPATGTVEAWVVKLPMDDDITVGTGSDDDGTRVWPESEPATVHANRPVPEVNLTLSADEGDRLAFLTRATDDDGDHTVDWNPQIRYE